MHPITSMLLDSSVHALGPDWMDPDTLINGFIERWGTWALAGICLIIVIETGLLFPFLPGDSLLFTAGLFTGTGQIQLPIWAVAAILGFAAFIGPQSGYWIGRLSGPKIFNRPDSRFFKKAYVDRTHAFFEQYGGRAIVLAQFVPFVRTYIPVAAGVGRMPYLRFVRFNVIGALVWGVGVTLLGFWLGQFAIVKDNIEIALMLVVLVSVLPILFEAVKHQLEARRAAPAVESRETLED
ncbi:VTT domain-containing protein [Demequina capsici]|uniref:VTT domain-containing protein n=1 Tax=Demequina capsici TaxID=3075620 RepID=A0AA96FAK1_9MICO|nr:VTT domain-containing protein [Demequina sp. OYTSA14]WNM24680.1 VTT domain-containing protein [Demequina sp. OYTSA14]